MRASSGTAVLRLLPAALAAGLCLTAPGCRQKPEPAHGAVEPSPLTVAVAYQAPPELVREAASRDRLHITPEADRSDVNEALTRFYAERRNHLAWFSRGRPVPEAVELVASLRNADAEGLDPATYRPLLLERRIATPPPLHSQALADADTELSRAFVTFALHRLRGRVHPHAVDLAWYSTPRRRDLAAVLASALRGGGVEATLAALDPPYESYRALRRALSRYRGMAAAGGWPAVPPGAVLHEGDAAPCSRLETLHERLAKEGYASLEVRHDHPVGLEQGATPRGGGPPGLPCSYGPDLVAALERFQADHGLAPDGVVGAATLQALDVPAAARATQIELNMERWRWLPESFGDPCVLVNLAAYRLAIVEHGREVLTMRVIVGKEGWTTPVFSDRVQTIVLNPYWYVPESIVEDEILPAVARDPGYLVRNGFEVYLGQGEGAQAVDPSKLDAAQIAAAASAYHFRQRPGAGNPLGTVKFLFPNSFSIYLHGTPGTRLFDLPMRARSHGCVRIEHPLALATYLLRDDPRWTREKLREEIDSGRRVTITLRHPIPVHLLYWTADEHDGVLELLPDVYGVDAAVGAELARETAAARE